jgi:hypothetical protein
MSAFLIFILLGTGLAIGLISGLLGIGGGVVLTPVQYWIYSYIGINDDMAIKMAVATTLAVVLPTAASVCLAAPETWRHLLGYRHFYGYIYCFWQFRRGLHRNPCPGSALRSPLGP